MYCQECGSEIRVHAKFCNSCGTQVRQRFGPPAASQVTTVPPPPEPPPPNQPLSAHSWPNAEDAIVMPVIGGGRPREEMPTRRDVPAPGISTDKNRVPPQTGRMNGSRDLKPFFTQVGTAVSNRQHNRLVMVVPILLLVVVLLFIFAYIASK